MRAATMPDETQIDLDEIPARDAAKGRASNDVRRVVAHALLDKMLDSVDDVRGAYGSVRLDVPYQNGYFQRIEHTIKGIEQ